MVCSSDKLKKLAAPELPVETSVESSGSDDGLITVKYPPLRYLLSCSRYDVMVLVTLIVH